ncbi:KICSTOR subunit 2-like [Vespula maculifrons]|uniref:KICSTOR subunit 2-like n=1 Tax=Vespula maculifrons TaxID=7453 RepID=A0ABD2B446_VESMC
MDHEEEFLNNFFTRVKELCSDKTKGLEKEQETCRQIQIAPWGILLITLPQIAFTKRYCIAFGFHQKERFPEKRCIQFIYEKIYSMTVNNKVMKYEELLQSINTIVQTHSLSCSHLALTAIKTTLTLECEILVQLTEAHIEIQHWRFLPTLMALFGAQTRMSAWERTLHSKESWKLGFGATFLKANQQPALYQWLVKLKNAILAKCSLYFHTTLSQQANPGEMRSIMSKQSVDYYHKIQSFQRKHDVVAVLIVFDSKWMKDSGPGYRHSGRKSEVSKKFTVVVSCPYNNIQNKIRERYAELLTMDKIIYAKSLRDLCTYALYNMDPKMTLVTIYETEKQKDKERHVSTFIFDMCTQIECNKIYEFLKLLLGAIQLRNDLNEVIDCIPNILISINVGIEFIGLIFNSGKLKRCIDRMAEDWQHLSSNVEIELLKSFTVQGRKYKLKHLGEEGRLDVDLNIKKIDDNNYRIALDCLRKHIKVIEFSEFIDGSFSVSYLFSLGLFVLVLAVSGTQVLMHTDQLNEAVRYASLFMAILIQLFWQCWQGQRLLNSSNIPYESANQGQWYYTSTRCKKTLALIMIRSSKPCEITAMNLMTFSIETFSSEKEQETCRQTQNSSWKVLLMTLLQIAFTECYCIALGFHHKERSSKLEEMTRRMNNIAAIVAEVFMQLYQFILIRIQLIDFLV